MEEFFLLKLQNEKQKKLQCPEKVLALYTDVTSKLFITLD